MDEHSDFEHGYNGHNDHEDIFIRKCISGDTNHIKKFISSGGDIHVQNNLGLVHASRYGNFEIVKLLIQNGANIHEDKDCPLCIAIECNKFDIVKILIENGADVCADSNYPLYVASFYGFYEIVKYLIEHGASLYERYNGLTPIESAATAGQIKIVKYFINMYADKRFLDSATFFAYDSKKIDVMKLLLYNDAVDARIKLNFHELLELFYHCKFESVYILLKNIPDELKMACENNYVSLEKTVGKIITNIIKNSLIKNIYFYDIIIKTCF